MDSSLVKLILYLKRKNLIPQGLRALIQKHVAVLNLRTASWIAKDPYANEPPVSSYKSKYPYTLGIIKEFWHVHWPYIAACKEMGVAYKLIDISGPDWIDVINDSACDAFLVSPSVELSIWKQMFDERLRIITKDLGKIIFPTYDELWFYESKRRMHYWLEVNNVLHPKTWIFYDLKQALDFAEQAELPIVYKSDLGSGASGVRIFRKRDSLRRHIRRCFKRGFTTYRRCRNDKEWGFVLLQEYLPDAREWRMIRIGDSFFGHEKGKVGDFHSGSHVMLYSRPPLDLLSLVRDITDKGGFSSMDCDILMTKDDCYLVNELQPIFGMDDPSEPQCMVNGKPGRYIYDEVKATWVFEEGIFTENFCCNLRVMAVLKQLDKERGAVRHQEAKI